MYVPVHGPASPSVAARSEGTVCCSEGIVPLEGIFETFECIELTYTVDAEKIRTHPA